jgi:hypothetical protein
MDRSYIDRNRSSSEALRAKAAELSDEDLAKDLGEGWTAAVHFAHMAFWDRRASVLIDRWQRQGVGASSSDQDANNAAMLPQWKLLDPRQAVEDAVSAAEEADQSIAVLSDEQLTAILEAKSLRLDRSRHRLEDLSTIQKSLR